MTDRLEPLSVDVSEACRLTGLGRSKLYELLASGEISSFKVGKRRLIRVASLRARIDRFAEDHRDTWSGAPLRKHEAAEPAGITTSEHAARDGSKKRPERCTRCS